MFFPLRAPGSLAPSGEKKRERERERERERGGEEEGMVLAILLV